MGIAGHTAAFKTAARDEEGRLDLLSLSREGLIDALTALGEKPFRARQLWAWIYKRGFTDFQQMTDIAKPLRQKLSEHFIISRPRVTVDRQSVDGTRKWLLGMGSGHEVEAVHIPETDRGALCVSSQVGCTLTCSFCHTGTQRLVRNLEPQEIIGQVLLARDHLDDHGDREGDRRVSNIVMMGMGEPLYNFENMAQALKVVMDGDGIAISKRRITLSTSGVVPMMHRAGSELGVNLAVSLHAVNDELRSHLVPLNRKYPIAELMQACRDYPGINNARRITFEYVMLDGINDSDADARELVRLLRGIPAKVNLIPFNPWPGSPYERSSWKRIEAFSKIVMDAGYASPVRTPRGEDILAACGQLKSASQRRSAADRRAADEARAAKQAELDQTLLAAE